MFLALATAVTRRGWWIVAGWVLLAVVLHTAAPRWDAISRDDDTRFFPADSLSVRGLNLMESGFARDASSSQIVFVAERRDAPLSDADWAFLQSLKKVLNTARKTQPELQIKKIIDANSPVIGERLVSAYEPKVGQAALVIVALKSTYLSKRARLTVDAIEKTIQSIRGELPSGLRLAMTGSAVVGHNLNSASNRSIATTTYTTIGLVVVILLFVYQSPLLALVPLVSIALSVWVSLKAIALLTLIPGLNFQVINITEVFVVVVLFGAGTDYCLFLISRYRELLAEGYVGAEALGEAIHRVGGALLASAGTVICGLGLLWFSSFAKISNTGPAIALSLVIALIACLTVAPVLLLAMGRHVFWPFPAPSPRDRNLDSRSPTSDTPAEYDALTSQRGIWHFVANAVVKYPGWILGLSVAVMLPLAVIGFRTESNYSQLADLESNQSSVVGARVTQSHFAVGELSPSTVLIEHSTLRFRSPEGRAAIEQLSKRFEKVEGVQEVRSLTQPLGVPIRKVRDGEVLSLAERTQLALLIAAAENRFLGNQNDAADDDDDLSPPLSNEPTKSETPTPTPAPPDFPPEQPTFDALLPPEPAANANAEAAPSEPKAASDASGSPSPSASPSATTSVGASVASSSVQGDSAIATASASAASSSQITRLELIFNVDPFSSESLEILDRVRAVILEQVREGQPLAGVSQWGISGATATISDLKSVTRHDERQMYWMVTLGVYLILVVLLRRPGLCLYLMVTVVFGYLVALGLTEVVFRDYYWQGRMEPWGGLDWKVGFFLFVILIAVGEDYNIFLMSRVLEEQKRFGAAEGTRRAILFTGGIISSCGLIMAGTFGSMLTGSLLALKELGFALAVGVLLDTFVVRPVLVPAFLILWDRYFPRRGFVPRFENESESDGDSNADKDALSEPIVAVSPGVSHHSRTESQG